MTTTPTMNSDLKVLEHSTLKVPYEVLNKKFRIAQKVLDREAAYVTQAGNEIEKLLSCMPPVSLSPSDSTTVLFDAAEVARSMSETSAMDQSEDVVVKPTSKRSRRSKGNANTTAAPAIPVEMDTVMQDVQESMNTEMKEDGDKKSDNTLKDGPKGAEVAKLLGVLVDRLGSMKRKVSVARASDTSCAAALQLVSLVHEYQEAGESIQDELEAARAVRKRAHHLKTYASSTENISSTPSQAVSAWRKTRFNRMLVDHLLREGMYDTASLLAEQLNIKDLTNIDIFWAAKEVEESLKRHETGRVVAWCHENKSKLRKILSTLELEIRIQEFVELVRAERRAEAVKHARKYLADSQSEDNAAAIKKCMGLLAFPTNTNISPYAELLSPDRWTDLTTHFRHEHARLYNLTTTSVLGAVVQAGLASLKTPQCYRSATKNTNCPVCTDPLSDLAAVLPYAHCAHSQLVCAISGEPLNENNPPLMLPTGYVYGTRSLQDLAKSNGGKIICPRGNSVFSLSQAEKVYVM